MKRIFSVLLILALMASLCACGGDKQPAAENTISGNENVEPTNNTTEPTENATEQPTTAEEDQIEDAAWDDLEAVGKIETENGEFFVSITVPADLAGEDVTQESIDANAGETYTSGKLNEDGSVTYKMTKKQHRAMLDNMASSIDEAIKEMVNSSDNAFTEIAYNKDFTCFDVQLSTSEVGMTEGFMAIAFYMYGGLYSIFSGKDVDNITINYYGPDGNLITSTNSSDMNG